MEQGERDVDLLRAMELAVGRNLSAYDAEFIVLAQSMSVPLVTEDRRLVAAFPSIAVSMEAFCNS